jgi:hypothetical protein
MAEVLIFYSGHPHRPVHLHFTTPFGKDSMKKSILPLILCALVVMSCGKKLSDADKATALAGLGAVQGLQPSVGFERDARAIAEKYVADHRTCTAAESDIDATISGDTGSVHVKTECPDTNTWKFTMTATGPITRTCGTTQVTFKDLSAIITVGYTARSSFSFSYDLGVTLNDKALKCGYSASYTGTDASGSTASNYSCTYDGADVTQEDALKAQGSCATR